jgi:hypothetical protein
MKLHWRARRLAPLLLVVLGLGCGARSLRRTTVQGMIVDLPEASFGKDDITIESVQSLGGRSAIAEARVRAALRLEKVGGSWVIREVRIGRRPWTRIDTLLETLERVKVDETRRTLEHVAEAVARYRAAKGALPEFRDYVSLSDALHPDFLNPLVREDAWQRPLAAFRSAPDTVRLVSAGPDGKLGTADDVEVVRRFQ